MFCNCRKLLINGLFEEVDSDWEIGADPLPLSKQSNRRMFPEESRGAEMLLGIKCVALMEKRQGFACKYEFWNMRFC